MKSVMLTIAILGAVSSSTWAADGTTIDTNQLSVSGTSCDSSNVAVVQNPVAPGVTRVTFLFAQLLSSVDASHPNDRQSCAARVHARSSIGTRLRIVSAMASGYAASTGNVSSSIGMGVTVDGMRVVNELLNSRTNGDVQVLTRSEASPLRCPAGSVYTFGVNVTPALYARGNQTHPAEGTLQVDSVELLVSAEPCI